MRAVIKSARINLFFSRIIIQINSGKSRTVPEEVTNLNNWHTFLNLFAEAGYLSKNLIASNYVVVFSYVLYLIGKDEYKVLLQN